MGNIKLNNMEKEFVPYEQALALKELGFNSNVFKSYDTSVINLDRQFLLDYYYNVKSVNEVKAPLYQQAFRWFREKYNLHSYIIDSKSYKWYFNIDDMTIDDVVSEVLYFKTYEEAELECLKKLIEIVNG